MLRVLLIGCGDIALRTAALLRGRVRLYGLTRRPDDVARLRAQGIVPIVADLDRAASLRQLRTAPWGVLHFAPPPPDGRDDPRTRHLVAALSSAQIIPQRLVYVSTSGVYGDCAGARVDETRPRRAQTPRARRRVSAEATLRAWAARNRVSLAILRVPGIYAEGRLPLERVRHATPVLAADDDVYTNHIHADDLARACIAALWRGRAQRVVHASDDSDLRMGDYVDLAADLYGLPRPPRISRADAVQQLPATTMSFMGESRRLDNTRLKRELRVVLRYPTVRVGLTGG